MNQSYPQVVVMRISISLKIEKEVRIHFFLALLKIWTYVVCI